MTPDALQNIKSLVTSTFDNALNSADVTFEGSKIVEQLIEGCTYQVRYIPGLAEKPEKGDAEKSSKVPLAPPDKKSMHVCDAPTYGLNATNYAVLLNKFPSTKYHFLLAPQEFVNQSDPLTVDDLSLTYQIIRNHRQRKLIAFFNCGEESGASQKHKHVQFCPVSPNDPPIDVFLPEGKKYEQVCQLAQVPRAHFFIDIHPPKQSDQIGDYLMQKFIQLLDEMFTFKQEKELDGAKASYNVLITENYMHMISRSREEFELPNGSKVSIGSVNYAGLIIVKQEEDLDEMKKVGVKSVLLSVGRKKDEENEQ